MYIVYIYIFSIFFYKILKNNMYIIYCYMTNIIMYKIQTKNEYDATIVEILNKIYDLSNEENEKIVGVKNKEQPYELKIKKILNEYCVETIKKKNNTNNTNIDDNTNIKYDNLFFEYQPNGSQQPPDFQIHCENYETKKIECKSSKNNRPVWNCSIPEPDTIYVYYDTQKKLTYIFEGDKIISNDDRNKIIKFNDELKKLCIKFNNSTLDNKNISYYPRQMINQTKKMDIIIPNRDIEFKKLKNKILSIDCNNKTIKKDIDYDTGKKEDKIVVAKVKKIKSNI